MSKRVPLGVLLFLTLFFPLKSAFAEEGAVRVNAIVLVASNNGNDFDLANDEYRDQLIQLFSYTSYKEQMSYPLVLDKAERRRITIADGYELVLTLQGVEKDRILVQAVVRKDNKQYVDTVLSILRPGVIFLGGPPSAEEKGGVLIIVLETGF